MGPALAALEASPIRQRSCSERITRSFRPHVTDAVLDKTTWPSPEENLQALSSLDADRRKAIAYENGLVAFGIALPAHMHAAQAT